MFSARRNRSASPGAPVEQLHIAVHCLRPEQVGALGLVLQSGSCMWPGPGRQSTCWMPPRHSLLFSSLAAHMAPLSSKEPVVVAFAENKETKPRARGRPALPSTPQLLFMRWTSRSPRDCLQFTPPTDEGVRAPPASQCAGSNNTEKRTGMTRSGG